MSLDEHKLLVSRFIAAVNGRELDALDELLTDDFSIPPDRPDGLSRDGLKSVLKYYIAAFPDLKYEMRDQVAEGDMVVTRSTMQGTHRGTYRDHVGSGKTFAVDEVDIFQIDKGKIAGYRIIWDEMAFEKQLGLT